MTTEPVRITSASAELDVPAATIFELIANPARQPDFDGNDNLAEVVTANRIRGVGEVFAMRLTNGAIRENTIVEFTEGRLLAWLPNEPGHAAPGHLWRWELTPLDSALTRVTHTYDWTQLSDPTRLERARATTAERLHESIARLATLFE